MRPAFSLFEMIVSICVLGMLGVVCSYMLLNVTKNIAFLRTHNDLSPTIALLKVQNALQYAIPQSISDESGTFPTQTSHALHFWQLDSSALYGGGDKSANITLKDNIKDSALLPHISLEVESSADFSLYLKHTSGFKMGDKLYLASNPKAPFSVYSIKGIRANALVLDKSIESTPLLALPIIEGSIRVQDSALWLNDAILLENVHAFSIEPKNTPNGAFLALHLCIKALEPICTQGGVWLDDIVEILP